MSVTNRRISFIFFLLGGAIVLFVLADKRLATQNTSANDSVNQPKAQHSPEYMLAAIDNNLANEPTYALALNLLEPKCQESRIQISDMSVASRKLYQDKGIDLTHLQVLKTLLDATPSEAKDLKCAEVLAFLVTAAK